MTSFAPIVQTVCSSRRLEYLCVSIQERRRREPHDDGTRCSRQGDVELVAENDPCLRLCSAHHSSSWFLFADLIAVWLLDCSAYYRRLLQNTEARLVRRSAASLVFWTTAVRFALGLANTRAAGRSGRQRQASPAFDEASLRCAGLHHA